jgi:hypothetical protein
MAGMKILERPRFSMPAATIFTVFVVVAPFLLVTGPSIDEERFPVAAAAALDDVPTFHDDVAGGYLIWSEGPERLVFLDDRAELYGERMREFVEIRDLERDWRPLFERDGIEQVLLQADEELLGELASAGWSITYKDEFFVVMRP